MLIDWQNFTPWTSLSGGALIGLSAALLLLFNGRIAGIAQVVAEEGVQMRKFLEERSA